MKRASLVLSFLAVVFISLLFLWLSRQDFGGVEQKINSLDLSQTSEREGTPSAVSEQKIMVVDGDTIDVDGVRVRYIGMDTPELGHGRAADDCFAKESADYNRNLVANGGLRLEKDVSETDKYGRLLRYVYLSDGRMVNEELVKQGYAKVATYPPDVRNAERFRQLEREAKAGGRGLWGKCF